MRILVLTAVFCMFVSGCASTASGPTAPGETVTYKDTNGDGVIDLENHTFPTPDMDWQYIDQDYDGFYDKKIVYGYVKGVTLVTKRVPQRPPSS